MGNLRRVALMLALCLIVSAPFAQTEVKKKKGKKTAAGAVAKAGKGGTPKAAPTPEPKLKKIIPYLTIKGDAATSMMVNWWNPAAEGDSTVMFGTSASYGQTKTEATSTNYHHVELTGLTPGATYHYQVRSSDGTVGEDNTFTLPEVNDQEYMFAVSGDSRGTGKPEDLTVANPRRKAEYDHIASKKPGFVVNVGDIAITGANKGHFVSFFECEEACLKSAPYMITVGNHEMGDKSGKWPDEFLYPKMFAPAYPGNGTPGDSGQPTPLGMNFSYDYGNAHFIFISSEKMTPKSEVEWIDRDLAAARQNKNVKWIFAMMHAPLYTWATGHPGEQAQIEAWGPLFDKYHVDLAFAGHNHIYERSHVINGGKVVEGDDPAKGTIYLTCGLGGAPLHQPKPADPKYPFIVKSYNGSTAASFVYVKGDKLEIKTMSPQDEVVDTLTIDKSAGPK